MELCPFRYASILIQKFLASDDMGKVSALSTAVAGVLLVGVVDYLSGTEIRVYPLYFLPLSLAAWHFGRRGAVAAVIAVTAIWWVANSSAGLIYSADYIWWINAFAQAAAFGTVAGLLSWARNLLDRERKLSLTDSLTGLANSRAFYASAGLAAASCRRAGRPVTIAYIDLDNFKCVNDRYGHAKGDILLKDVAKTFGASLRVSDLAARMGGDEFVVFLPETSESQAEHVLDRLRSALEKVFPDNECAVSASIGAFCWDVPLESVDAMVSAADEMMYEVKKSGKNNVKIVSMTAGQASVELANSR